MNVRPDHVARGRLEKMEVKLDDIERKLEVVLTVNDKMDTLLAMIAPVHAHAAWVDTLRKRLSSIGLVKDKRIANGDENV
jgi:hypothetical protein